MRFVLLALTLFVSSAAAQCTSKLVSSGTYGTAQGASGPARYVVYMPEPASCFNGKMVLYAHGYINPGSPANRWLEHFTLPDGTTLPSILNGYGFGFAASSFSKDGLAIQEGIQDTKALTNVISSLSISPQKYYITGASEGGLITAKSMEEDPSYVGGLAVCGPVGDFRKQINYFGDGRVLFDYFFPGILGKRWTPENATVPSDLADKWTTVYEPAIRQAVNANFLATYQYVVTANIPLGFNFSNAADAITQVLRYSAFSYNDARATLHGNPYDNIGRTYSGSFNDGLLNTAVARFAVDSSALGYLAGYETTGLLRNPLVTLHTIFDPQVPYWHEGLYQTKVNSRGRSAEFTQLPSFNYGHCEITSNEAVVSLVILLLKSGL